MAYCRKQKLADGFYAQEFRGFLVMAAAPPSAHRGGVTIFYREAEHFAIEELCLHGPNVISFQQVTVR